MAISYVRYNGTGAQTNFSITFPYLDEDHVEVRVDGSTVSFTWVNSTTVAISPAPVNGAIVELRRNTPSLTPIVEWQDGAIVSEEQLAENTKQALFVSQESEDSADDALSLDSTGIWDAATKRIKNVSNPSSAQDAATKAYVDAQVGEEYAEAAEAAAITATSAKNAAEAAAAEVLAKSHTFSNFAALRLYSGPATSAFTISRTTFGDEGGGFFSVKVGDTTTPDDGAIVLVDAAGRRWWRVSRNGWVSPRWWGAVGDNIAIDTIPWNNMLTYVQAQAFVEGVDIGVGFYKIDYMQTLFKGVTFRGVNPRSSMISILDAAGRNNAEGIEAAIHISGIGHGQRAASVKFFDMAFHAGDMTGGYMFSADWAQQVQFSNCLLISPYNGFHGRQFGDCLFHNCLFDNVRGDVGVDLYGAYATRNGEIDNINLVIFDTCIIQSSLPPMPTAATSSTVMARFDGYVHTVQCDGLRLLNGGIGMQTLNTPGLAQNLVPRFILGSSIEVENMYSWPFDLQACMEFTPSYMFAVGSHTKDGVRLSPAVGIFAPDNGNVSTNFWNGIDTNGAKDTRLQKLRIYNNSLVGTAQKFGVFVSGSGNFYARDCLFGKDTVIPDYSEPQSAGIGIDGSYTGTIIVENCDLRGNVNYAVQGAGFSSIYSRITNCPGYNPVGQSTPTVGASPFSYTAGFSQEQVFLSGGTGVSVTIGATTIPATSFVLQPRQTVVITHSGAPTMTVNAA